MKKKMLDRTIVLICISVLLVLGLALWSVINTIINNINEKNVQAVFSQNLEMQDNTEISIEELNEKETINEIEDENKIKNENKTTTNASKTNNTNIYYLKVNYGANVTTVYTKDENGEYTVPVKAILCSTGSATPTSGVYRIQGRWRWLSLLGGVYGQYCTQVVGNILFHSVPYLSKSNNDLEYWEFDKLGTKCSAGCIRMTVIDAKWIYDNVSRGTQVEFYSNSNPGPLGKPSGQKISENEELRGWDPTDPDESNPWRLNNKENVNITEEATNEIENNTVSNNNVSSENNTTDDNNVSSENNTTDDNNVSSENNTVDNNNVSSENNTVDDNNVSSENNTVGNNEVETDNDTIENFIEK